MEVTLKIKYKKSLIKRDGGTGPMKSGNLSMKKLKRC